MFYTLPHVQSLISLELNTFAELFLDVFDACPSLES